MKKIQTLLIPSLLIAVLAFTGCYKNGNHVEGNYDVITETRELPYFNRVTNEGSFDVYVIQDSLSQVEIVAESNLVPLIRTNLQGSQLIIDTRDNLRPHFQMKLYIHTTDINEVILSGSGYIHADTIETNSFNVGISGSGDIYGGVTANDITCWISGSGKSEMEVYATTVNGNISGSGSMEFWGEAFKSQLIISGSGSMYTYDLVVEECYANISGSGNMYVNASEYLDVTISGSGSIFYLGNPQIVSRISGSGSIIRP